MRMSPYMPFATCMPTGAVAQWYTYRPWFSALNVNCDWWPGAVKLRPRRHRDR
jgi:hypothetical protein